MEKKSFDIKGFGDEQPLKHFCNQNCNSKTKFKNQLLTTIKGDILYTLNFQS